MAAVSRLELAQFRSHAALELELPPGPVVLFGPNGAGKTNLLEAVSLLSPGRGMRGAAAEDLARRPAGVGWRVGARLKVGGEAREVDARAEPGRPRQIRIDDKPAPQVALGRLARIVWLVPSMDRLWTAGAEGRRRFLDRIALSFEPSHAEAVLTYDKARRERNRLLKDQVRDDHWYAALERQMALAGAAIQDNRAHAVARLAAAQQDARDAFPKADLSLAGEDPQGSEALARAFREGRRDDTYAGRTLRGPHRADLAASFAAKGVPAAQSSTGEQKVLLIALLLANARALAADHGAPPILLLDEVAAHLDAARRHALYDELAALGAQAWMTGTEPALFDGLGGATRLAVAEGPEGSAVAAA